MTAQRAQRLKQAGVEIELGDVEAHIGIHRPQRHEVVRTGRQQPGLAIRLAGRGAKCGAQVQQLKACTANTTAQARYGTLGVKHKAAVELACPDRGFIHLDLPTPALAVQTTLAAERRRRGQGHAQWIAHGRQGRALQGEAPGQLLQGERVSRLAVKFKIGAPYRRLQTDPDGHHGGRLLGIARQPRQRAGGNQGDLDRQFLIQPACVHAQLRGRCLGQGQPRFDIHTEDLVLVAHGATAHPHFAEAGQRGRRGRDEA